jgi:hypothetical protein
LNKSFYIREREIERLKKMANTLLFSNTITDTYKQTSDAINAVDLNGKRVIKKTLVEMMKQSFFHGASRFGTNFIA